MGCLVVLLAFVSVPEEADEQVEEGGEDKHGRPEGEPGATALGTTKSQNTPGR